MSNSSLQVDRRHEKATGKGAKECSSIPQRDGIDDEYDSVMTIAPLPLFSLLFINLSLVLIYVLFPLNLTDVSVYTRPC